VIEPSSAGVGADVVTEVVLKNARLTSLTGLILLILLFLEGITVLEVGTLIVPHLVIGTLLLAPVAFKLGTTGWKIVRYYAHSPEYVRAGPPPLPRRLLAPVVMVTTVGLLGTGVALMLLGPSSTGQLSFLHKAFFVLWFVAMALHVLIHALRSLRSVLAEYGARGADVLPGRGGRLLALAGVLVVGAALAMWATGFTAPWTAVFHG
jgi:hypothetical protein